MDIKPVSGHVFINELTTGLNKQEFMICKAVFWVSMINKNQIPVRWLKPTKNGTKVLFDVIQSKQDYDTAIGNLHLFLRDVKINYNIRLKAKSRVLQLKSPSL